MQKNWSSEGDKVIRCLFSTRQGASLKYQTQINLLGPGATLVKWVSSMMLLAQHRLGRRKDQDDRTE